MSGKHSVPPRRDPRSDPDDDETKDVPSSQRVDVVNVERATESIASVANTMRRELAKLHQQASAFERTLEDQRRERAEALDRAERATEHALSLEARLARMDDEMQSLRRLHETALDDLQKMRAERDDLSRAVDRAKESTEQMGRLERDLAGALKAREEASRSIASLETELAEIRKREHQEAAKGSDKDAEIAALREKVDRLAADLAAAQSEASKNAAEAVKTRQQLEDALGETRKARTEADRERAAAEGERERLERQLAEARTAEEQLVVARQDLAAAQKAVEDAAAESARIARELDAVRHERDVHVERAAMIERENAELRLADERMRRQLEGALQAATHAEARAGVAERARLQVEDGVRQLRDEITTAFARIRLVAPSLAPPPAEQMSARIAASVPPPPRPVDLAPESEDEDDAFPATRTATPLARRDELIAKLTDPIDARNAADALKSAPEWLRGAPTRELLDALAHADYDAERPVFEVARAWEREPLCRALLDALRAEQETRAREHAAWLLKHLASPAHLDDLVALASNDADSTGVRRWLLEALDSLAAGRHATWKELGALVTSTSKSGDATLRDGTIGVLQSLEPSVEKIELLLDIIERENDEVVLGDALDALSAVPPTELDEAVVARLLDHPSERVQRAAKELLTNAADDAATIDVD